MERQRSAEWGFAIENDHRDLKQICSMELSRRVRRGRNHIGLALRAFLRLEWHFYTTGVKNHQPRKSYTSG